MNARLTAGLPGRNAIATMVIAAACAGLVWWITAPPETAADAGQRPLGRQPATATPEAAQPAAAASRAGMAVPAAIPALKLPDAVGGAQDLKRVFDDHIGSADPDERRIAVRAFDACVPAFLASEGETPSPEALIRALPLPMRAEREAAYRLLYARCQGFVGQGRASLMHLQRELHADPALQEPGLQAREDLAAGRFDRVETGVSRALNSGDPAGVLSLVGLAERLAQARLARGADPILLQRAQAVDAALPRLACDLGLACGVSSLTSLQLCAVQGLCEGDTLSRLSQGAADVADPTAAHAQAARLLSLMRGGSALGTADLLPP